MNILPNMLEFSSGRKAIEFYAMQAIFIANNAQQTVRIEITVRGITLGFANDERLAPTHQCVYAHPNEEETDLMIRLAAMVKQVSLDISDVPRTLNDEEIALCRAGDRIGAIKSVRERAGRTANGTCRLGLREAKDMTDAYYVARPQSH